MKFLEIDDLGQQFSLQTKNGDQLTELTFD